MFCAVYQLGLVNYSDTYQLQRELLCGRLAGLITDTLLLLEHPPTITIGKSGKLENILVSQAQLSKQGVSLFFVDRGGDVTYHGPGQLIGYPIIDLRRRGKDAHQYLHDIEEVLIRTLNDFSIKSGRNRNHAGVWVSGEQIGAIGLSLRRWVSMHGFALDVNTDLEPFSLINPCGFSDKKVTSISRLLGQDIPMEAVTERLLAHFSEIFNARLELKTELLVRSCYEGKAPVLV
jgi:lipoate-protein ligase B